MREKELAEFLMNNPKYIPLQRAIDARLSELNTSEERISYLARLIQENLLQLNKELNNLNEILKCLKE